MYRRIPFPRRRQRVRSFASGRRQTPLVGEYRKTWDVFSKRRFSGASREAIHALLHLAQLTQFPARDITRALNERWETVWKKQKPANRECMRILMDIRDKIPREVSEGP